MTKRIQRGLKKPRWKTELQKSGMYTVFLHSILGHGYGRSRKTGSSAFNILATRLLACSCNVFSSRIAVNFTVVTRADKFYDFSYVDSKNESVPQDR